MRRRTKQTIKIGIFLDIPGLARSRAISGLYRFARQKTNWRIFQFPLQQNCAELKKLTKSFKLDAIFAGHADAVRAYGKNIPYVLLLEQ